jgi:hypothetical protein
MLRPWLSRLILLLFRRHRFCQTGSQSIEALVRRCELAVEKANTGDERGNVAGGGIQGSSEQIYGRLAQNAQHQGRIEAADAMAFQKLGNGCLADAGRLGGRRRRLPQLQKPFGAKVAIEFQQCRKIAPELFAQAVGEAIALRCQIVGDAGPFTKAR